MTVIKNKKFVIKFLVYFISFALIKLSWLLRNEFGSPTMSQILFHIQFGLDGLLDSDTSQVHTYVKHCLVLPILFAFALCAVEHYVPALGRLVRRARFGSKASADPKVFDYPSAKSQGALQVFFRRVNIFSVLAAVLLVVGLHNFLKEVPLWQIFQHTEDGTFFEDNYVFPASFSGDPQYNLVMVYVESLENGFSNVDAMGRDLLAGLERATAAGTSFAHYTETAGTDWTIAGLVSTQCGIPLKTFLTFGDNSQGKRLKYFLPSATCLGDVLNQHGYHNVFMQGSSLIFSGTGKFVTQHGYSSVYGKKYWMAHGQHTLSGWGLYDDQLLDLATRKIDELERSAKRFSLTVMTIDTHPPHGFVSPTCAAAGVADYKGIVSCTGNTVAKFVRHMKERGYLKNTVLVIVGDHLAMKGVPVHDALLTTGPRTMFNRIITPEPLVKNTEFMYPFSMYPTILYALGLRFNDGRLGLGASAFGPRSADYALGDMPPKVVAAGLSKPSALYRQFFLPPRLFWHTVLKLASSAPCFPLLRGAVYTLFAR